MKIFCIGRNYVNHAKELNNPVPSTPMWFMKPPTAALKNNNPFYYPDFSNEIHYECELVIKINKHGKNIQEKFAHKYYNEISVGIDFTARDIQAQCKTNKHPWEAAKTFDGSAVIGKFIEMPNSQILFSLNKNGKTVQQGNANDMLFNFNKIIAHVSQFVTLQKGDLIYTGTPAGVGPIAIGDKLEGFIANECLFTCEIK